MTRPRRLSFRAIARLTTAYVASGAVVVGTALPAYADVVESGNTPTTITGDPTTGAGALIEHGSAAAIAINEFTDFSINSGQTYTLVQPDTANALVNIVNSAGTLSSINGVLNTRVGDGSGADTSTVFLLDHDGFIVGATGRINASTLIMSTASNSFSAQVLGGDTDALNDLMAGGEELNPNGVITFESGSQVNAKALELHVGGALVMNGTISVDDADLDGTSAPVAVNTSHLTQATGASVEGGVIRFGARSATVGGTVSATRGGTGGQVSGVVTESFSMGASASIDVSGGAGAGGTILIGGTYESILAGVSDATLTFAAGSRLDASSVSGEGGFVFARGADLSFGGTVDLAGAADANGAVLIEGKRVVFEGATTTLGGDIAVVASEAITVNASASIDTTSATLGGDISLISRNIQVGSGARLDADVAGTETGGLVALLAHDEHAEVGLPVADVGATATIDVDAATLEGGAIVISALARTTNQIDDTTAASVEAAQSAQEDSDGTFTDGFAMITGEFVNLFEKGRDTLSEKIPFQIKDIDARATISITGATLSARGNWSGAATQTPAPVAGGEIADNGVLRADGLQTRDYSALIGRPLVATTVLPNAFDATRDSLYIHANAETEVEIAPLGFALSTATALTDTTATVRIENSDLTAITGDATLYSSTQDKLKIDLNGAGIKGAAIGNVVAAHNSVNQLLTLGGSITANDGSVRAGAFTGKSHDLSTRIGAGEGGVLAVAVTVSLGSSVTEAVLGGTLTAGALDLDAETIYFKKSHETRATLGSASSVSDSIPTSLASAAGRVAAAEMRERLMGGDDEDATKNKLATALAVDVQLDTNETYAGLGGTYRDWTAGGVRTAMAGADVTVVDAVTVDATQRFGRFDEGGEAISRVVNAQALDLSSFISNIPYSGSTIGQPNQGTDVALFGTFSMSRMAGETRAEIGAGTQVTAGSVAVDALTQYQTVDQLTNFRDRWRVFTDELEKIDVTGTITGNPDAVPDFDAASDGIVFATTSVGTKSVQSAAAENDQKFAMGASVNMFETDNLTEARIRDGASVTTTSGSVAVTAREEAVFTHMSAGTEGGSRLDPSGTAGNLIGANVSVPRMLSTVVAEVGNASITSAGDLVIDAENDIIQVGVSRASGSAAKVAVNGAVAVNIFETTTIARLGAQADVTANGLTITAEDQSTLISLAGTKSGSTSVGVGASAVVNLVSRDTRAEIGNAEAASLPVNGGEAITVDALTLSARNSGLVFGSALAGSKVAGTAAGSAAAGAEDNDQSLSAPSALLSDDEESAVAAQSQVTTDADATGATRMTGLAVSGATTLNLFKQNDALATVATNSRITVTGAASVRAANTARDVGLAGSFALGFGLDLSANALAGAYAMRDDNRDVRVLLRGTTLNAASVTGEAKDDARGIGVAVGGAGGKSTLVSLAGSVTNLIERGETSVRLVDVTVNAGAQSFVARNFGSTYGIAGAVGAASGGLVSVGLSVASAIADRDAVARVEGSALEGSAITLEAASETDIFGIAASGGFGTLSLTGAAVSNTNESAARASVSGSTIEGGNVAITGRGRDTLYAFAGNASIGAQAALGGALALNRHAGGAGATLADSLVTGETVAVTADALATLRARGLSFVGATGSGIPGASVAASLAIAVNTSEMTVATDIDGAEVLARENIVVNAIGDADVSGLTLAAAAAGTGAAAGTATTNRTANTVTLDVRDTNGVGAPKLYAAGSIALLSRANTTVSLLGGGDEIPDLTGNFAGAGTAGLGASVTVNLTDNQVTTAIADGADIQGFGRAALTSRHGTTTGVVIDALATTNVEALAVSAGVAGTAALTGIFTYNTLSDDATVSIGDGADTYLNTRSALTAALSAELSDRADILTVLTGGATIEAASAQTTRIEADVISTADSIAVAATLAGTAAAGASGTGTVIDGTATVRTNTAVIGAASDIVIDAVTTTDITTRAYGLAGGKGAVAASVVYNAINGAALVDLTGTRLTAQGAIAINAGAENSLEGQAGNVAGGGGAGAGGVVVNVLASKAEVRTAATIAPRFQLFDTVPASGPVGEVVDTYIAGRMTANGTIDIGVTTTNTADSLAVSGAAGGGFVALSSSVTLLESVTSVEIGAGEEIEGQDVSLAAVETTDIGNRTGVIGAGAVGVGGALDYVDVAGNASVVIGAGADISARDALAVSARSSRGIDGDVGIASIASASLTAAVSLINIGTLAEDTSGEGAAMLAASKSALGENTNADTGAGSVGALAGRAGANDSIDAVEADRAGRSFGTATSVDGTGVALADGAVLRAGGDVDVAATVQTGVDQNVGVASGSVAALSAAVGVVELGSRGSVTIGTDAQVLSAGAVNITATSTARAGAPSVTSSVNALAVSAAGAAAAGVSIVDASNEALIDIGGGARIGLAEGESRGEALVEGGSDYAAKVTIAAARDDTVVAEVGNYGVSGGLAIGALVARAQNTGAARVRIGDAAGEVTRIESGNVALSATDRSRASAGTVTAQGGTVAGAAGAHSIAVHSGTTAIALTRTQARAATVNLSNLTTARAIAEATGGAVGALAVGVTIAEGRFDGALTTTLSAVDVEADTIDIETELNDTNGTNVVSGATAGTGGIAAGGGAVSTAFSSYTAETIVDGGTDAVLATRLSGRTRTLIQTRANGFASRSDASGITVGGLAIGVVIGEVGQDTDTALAGRVTTDLRSGTLMSDGALYIHTGNTQKQVVDVASGSGGLVVGAGVEARTHVNGTAQTKVGESGSVMLVAGDVLHPNSTRFNGELTLSAAQGAELSSTVDNTSASLVGASGAVAKTTANAGAQVTVGGGTRAIANFFSLNARNTLERAAGGYNMKSASGGGVVGAAVASDFDLGMTTRVDVLDGGVLSQIGDPNFAKRFAVGTDTKIDVADKLILDAGGLLALPLAASDVDVVQNGGVSVGDATLSAAGVLDIYTGADADVRSEVHSTSYGLAGTASARSEADYTGNNAITLGAGAELLSFSDIELRAGQGISGTQDTVVRAESRSFNKTVVPINLPPVADASAAVAASVDIGAGAKVIAYQDVDLSATSGTSEVVGYGLGKDFYLEILEGAASLVGVSLVLDIVTGDSTKTVDSVVNIAGEVRSGAYARRILYLDETNQLANGDLETGTDTGVFESNADAPDPSLYRVEENLDLVPELQTRRAALQALVDDPGTSQADRLRYLNSIRVIDQRIGDLGGNLITRITVDPLRASEGSVRINARRLTGAATGSLYAAGEADISIVSRSGAQLDVRGLEITDVEGGEISFNGALIAEGAPDYQFNASFGSLHDGENTVIVNTRARASGPPSTSAIGNIDVLGTLANYGGDVVVNSEFGSITQEAPIRAENVVLNAKVSLNVAPRPGINTTGGAPQVVYSSLMSSYEWVSDYFFNLTVDSVFGRDYANYAYANEISTAGFNLAASDGFINAGRDVTMLAEYTNINSLVRAGTGAYVVNIAAGMDTLVANLLAAGGTGRVRLDNMASDSRAGVIRTPHISDSTNAEIYLNYDTGRLEIDDLRVRGGGIYITSNVISTGGGRLEAVDGFGSLTLNSAATTDIVLGNVDLGGRPDGSGLEGLIRITDLSQLSNLVVDGETQFLMTDYRSIGGQVSVYDNNVNGAGGGGYEAVVDAYGNTILRPGNLIAGPTTGGTFTYAPLAGRDFVAVNERTRLLIMDQYDAAIVTGSLGMVRDLAPSAWYRNAMTEASNAGVVYGSENLILSAQYSDPRVLPEDTRFGDYAYAYDHTRNTYKLANGQTQYSYTDFDGQTHTIQINPSLYTDGISTTFENIYNIYPCFQDYYSLLYDIDPTLRASEDELNIRHKIIDMRSALFVETERDIHRFKADYGISVGFSGSNTADTSITSNGTLIFAGDLENLYARTDITSHGGSILSGGDRVEITAGALRLSAVSGSIGAVGGGALRLDLVADADTDPATVTPGVVSAIARDGIELFEISGDLNFGEVVTTAQPATDSSASIGAVSLGAQGDLIQAATAPAIAATDLTLAAASGAIYRADGAGGQGAVHIDLRDGRVDAEAQGDIALRETVGDFGVGTLVTYQGAITLDAPGGAIVDRNNVEQRDTRSLAELEALWIGELFLTEGTTEYDKRLETQIAGHEARVTAAYHTYWSQRRAAGGGPIAFTLDADIATSIGSERAAAYSDEMDARYAAWNTEDTYVAGYAYVETDTVLLDKIRDGAAWTTDELTNSIRAGLVLETGDTNLRIEDPNISSVGDITLTARDGVGEVRDPYVLVAPGPGGALSAADLTVLARADRSDFDIDGDGIDDLDANGNSLIRQEEDLNFAFTEDADGRATGRLNVTATANEIFMASETAAAIARIHGQDTVELRIDGWMTDARTGDVAITARDLVIESGNTSDIGALGNALTFALDGGTLTAASGRDVYLSAPGGAAGSGDVAVAALFAGGQFDLVATGAVTDAVASGETRIVAGGIAINAASLGTATTALSMALTETGGGDIRLTSTTGDIFATSDADARLARLDSAGGGGLTLTDGASLALTGASPIRFDGAAFALDLSGPVDLSGLVGAAVTGHHLDLTTVGGIGAANMPFVTDIASLAYAQTTPLDSALATGTWIETLGDLHVTSARQSTPDAVLSIVARGALRVDSLTSSGAVTLEADATLDIGTASTDALRLRSGGAIGGASTMLLSTALFDMATVNGAAQATLSAPTVTIANATVAGAGEDITLDILGAATMGADARIASDTGRVTLDVAGDFTVGQVAAGAGGDAALTLTVGGALDVVDATQTALVANADGAQSVLRLGESLPVGTDGLRVALERLDVTVARGDFHLNEEDTLTVERAQAAGILDLYTGGDVTLGALAAGQAIVVAAGGDLIGDAVTLAAPDVALFAFGGSLRGSTDDVFRADLDAGATLDLYARDNVTYSETLGDVTIGYAIARDGDLSLNAQDAGAHISAGIVGAGGRLTLSSQGDLTLNGIGTGTVDLADETALALAYNGATPYGPVTLTAPSNLHVTALGAGATLTLNNAHVDETVTLQADVIAAELIDDTRGNGLDITATGAGGRMAQSVTLEIATQGAATISDSAFDRAVIETQGSVLTVSNTEIGEEARFRQQGLELYASSRFTSIDADALVQMLTDPATGVISFSLANARDVFTDGLVINRRDGDTSLNAQRAVTDPILSEMLERLGQSRGAAGESAIDRLTKRIPFLWSDRDTNRVTLPLILAQNR